MQRQKTTIRRQPRTRRSHIEPLEERTLLAGISIERIDRGLPASVGTPQTLSAVADQFDDPASAAYAWDLSRDDQPYPFTAAGDTLEFVPYQRGEYQATLSRVANGQVLETTHTSIQISNIVPSGTARILLDAVQIQGQDTLSTANQAIYYGDDFVPVDPDQHYQLYGSARSADGRQENASETNSQYFGFACYDADQLQIHPLHVSKIHSAVDTWLSKPLQPGDQYVYLNDTRGWNNQAGAAWARSLALYDYTDGTGHTHADYTYTRNVTVGAWSAGGVEGLQNRIKLSTAWAGATVPAGTAARNATSGNTFNYAVLEGHRVPTTWSHYTAIIGGGIGAGKSDFRHGTRYIKPIILTNYLAADPQQIQWSNLMVTPVNSPETFDHAPSIEPTAQRGIHVTDHLLRVQPQQALQLSGWARSGTATGEFFEFENRQYFGFASYDLDQLPISPLHVSKIHSAVDTRLARPLQPGDRYVYLEDVQGWYNENGPGYTRSLAWFGYQNSAGQVYDDYTYTRHVLPAAWQPGAIDHVNNRIQLASPWQAPVLPTGTAVRNATDGASFNYSALNFQAVPAVWTQYTPNIGGTIGYRPSDFRPGTAFIKPVVLSNYLGSGSNQVAWSHVSLAPHPRPQLFAQSATLTTDQKSLRYANEFTRVTPLEPYQLTGQARSGNAGGAYNPDNQQYFGVAMFDADKFLIAAYHVSKFGSAVDTRLAQPLNPGDSYVYLEDVSGWYDEAGPSSSRSLALFGYTNSQGYTYDDYTYTRNVTLAAWDVGAIDRELNRIQLRTPWNGAAIEAGTAARNATSQSSFRYAIANHSVADRWQRFTAVFGAQAEPENRFFPGTAYVKPVVLTNYHGTAANEITWQHISLSSLGREHVTLPGTFDLYHPDLSTPADDVRYQWTQIAGPTAVIADPEQRVTELTVPDVATAQTLTFRIDAEQGTVLRSQTVAVTVRPRLPQAVQVEGLWIDPRLQNLPHIPTGPFVRNSAGDLLTIDTDFSYTSHDEGRTWSPPRPLFPDRTDIQVSDERALLQTHTGVIVAAFTNLAERHWTWDDQLGDAPGATLPTYVMRSLDGGLTWQDLQQLHNDWSGAVRDILQTQDGRIVFTAMKFLHEPGRHAVLTYASDDNGLTWTASNLIDLGGAGHHGGVSEATVTERADGSLAMLLRTNRGELWSAVSRNQANTWEDMQPSGIPSSSAPAMLQRLQSGRLVLAWNRPLPEGRSAWPLVGGDNRWSATPVSNHREELSLAFSDDDGETWSKPVVIAHRRETAGHDTARYVAYPYLFEVRPGHLWLTTKQGGLRVSLQESDFTAEPATIVAFGDSTTASRSNLTVYATHLQRQLGERDPDTQVINAGVPGNHTEDARRRFEEDVLAHRPDIAIIQFGINDAAVDIWETPPATEPRVALTRYAENLEHFVSSLRAQGAQVILMTPNPTRWTPRLLELYGSAPYRPDDEEGFNVLLTDYAQRLRELARTHNVALVDVYQAFEDYGQQADQSVADLLLDGMHPNDAGHQLITTQLNAAIQKLL